jgi:hypothetical protein
VAIEFFLHSDSEFLTLVNRLSVGNANLCIFTIGPVRDQDGYAEVAGEARAFRNAGVISNEQFEYERDRLLEGRCGTLTASLQELSLKHINGEITDQEHYRVLERLLDGRSEVGTGVSRGGLDREEPFAAKCSERVSR